jgi:hypothetical protein
VDGDTGYPYVNHATLKEGESIGGQKDELVVLILLFAAIAFVLLALAFGAFIADDKKVKKEELPSEDLIPPPSNISPLGPSSPDSSVPSEPPSPSERLSVSSKFPSELEHNSTCSSYPSPENIAPPEDLEEVKKSEDARGGEGH